MKRFIIGALLTAFVALAAQAQSAEKINDIANSNRVTYGQFCYLIATNSSAISDESNYSHAFDLVKKKNLFKEDILSSDPVPLSVVALMCCKTWKIDESLMFKISKAPRYAFRQLQALDIIPLTATPTSFPSGRQLLNIITLCIDYEQIKKGE